MDRLVAIAVSRRYLMVGLLAVVMIGGLIAFNQLNIEAYPDPTPPMVDIVTQSPGLSSEEIERYITIPIETQVSGIKNLRTMRTISLYGLSDVKLQFSFDYTYDEALQQVLNRLSQLLQAVSNSNINVGGNTVNIGAQSAVVRGVGLIRSIDNLANTMVSQSGGNPVLVKDIATVTVGEKPRLGIAGMNQDDDIVQGTVLMRRGEQSSPTISRVEQLVTSINNSSILPPGVRIERIYDRKDLIDITTATVLHNMVAGILLIVLLQWIFLGDLRSALIVGATIPFALFFAVIILVLRGESANLLSVGAIDFGLIVDATVIMVESIFRWLSGQGNEASEEAIRTIPPAGLHGKRLAIFHAAADVNRSIFFAAGIIIAGFIPLFTLSGVEGHIFGPMAKTYAYALAGGLLATFTITPAISAILLPEHVRETETILVRGL